MEELGHGVEKGLVLVPGGPVGRRPWEAVE